MAFLLQARMNIRYLMSNENPKSRTNKVAVFSTRITLASALAYTDAADEAARLATTVGALFTATNALSLGVPVSYGVTFDDVNQLASPPDPGDFVFPFDKFAASLHGATTPTNSQITIPARKDSAVTVESNGVSLQLDDGAAVAAWIVAYETVGLNEDLDRVNVEQMFIVS